MDALTFLEKSAGAPRQPIFVIAGDEDFLKRLVRCAILDRILGDADRDLAVSAYAGEKLDFPTVRNELDTPPFVGPARVVVVENADGFVTDNRDRLEKYSARPGRIGVLVLEVKTFPETTKLAKSLPDAAKISCKTPPVNRLVSWCTAWAKSRFGKKLELHAAELLIELVGPQLGLLAQEIEKLSVTVGEEKVIAPDAVEKMVGRSRSANVFHILNAVGDGDPNRALNLLVEILDGGDEPIAVLGALTGQLRRLAAVGRLTGEGQSLGSAMDVAGIPTWPEARRNAEKQLKHLGRRRLEKLMDWLVEMNLGLKGGSALPNRLQLERFLVRLSRPRD